MAARERVGDWAEKTSATMLLAAAVLGIVYEALHIFGGEELVRRLGSGEGALIFLVSLLCGGLGLERLLVLHKVRATIEDAREAQIGLIGNVQSISTTVAENKASLAEAREKMPVLIDDLRSILTTVAEIKGQQLKEFQTVERGIKKINQAESLIGTKEIEDAALEIIGEASDNDDINATNQYGPEGLSKNYVKAIADRVKKADENGGDMEYRVIMPVATGSDAELEDIRRKAFSDQAIEERLIEKHARHPYPLEVLIVGHSMIIALRGGRNRPTYEVAIRITDPEFVEKAANWFKEVAWLDAEKDPKTTK